MLVLRDIVSEGFKGVGLSYWVLFDLFMTKVGDYIATSHELKIAKVVQK